MSPQVEAHPDEPAMSPEPLRRVKDAAKRAWPYAGVPLVILIVVLVIFRHNVSWGD